MTDKRDPSGWHTRHEILQIRNDFALFHWTITFNHRSSNILADIVAKFVLAGKSVFCFDICNFDSLPPNLASIARNDLLG